MRPRPSRGVGPAFASTTFEGYAVGFGGGLVVLGSRQSCLDVLRSLQQSVVAMRREGLPTPSRVDGLIRLLETEIASDVARTSGSGSPELPQKLPVPTSSLSDLVEVKEAAHMLALTTRQVRNFACRLEGRKVRGTWVFDRATVTAAANSRTEYFEVGRSA